MSNVTKFEYGIENTYTGDIIDVYHDEEIAQKILEVRSRLHPRENLILVKRQISDWEPA